MIEALSINKCIDLAKYLHEILPNLLTLICSSKISNDENSSENHWKMRSLSTRLLVRLIKSYTTTKNNLELRIIGMTKIRLQNQLNEVLQKRARFPDEAFKLQLNSSITTRFGCLYILRELGGNAIFECLLPLLKSQFLFIDKIYKNFENSPADANLISGVKKIENLFSNSKSEKFIGQLNRELLFNKIGGLEINHFEEYFGNNLGRKLFEKIIADNNNTVYNPKSNASVTSNDNLPENTAIFGRDTPSDKLPESVDSEFTRPVKQDRESTVKDDLVLSDSSGDMMA